jgi:hypothetical protein
MSPEWMRLLIHAEQIQEDLKELRIVIEARLKAFRERREALDAIPPHPDALKRAPTYVIR